MSCLEDFYANEHLNGVILAVFACLCWSFFDLLNGLVRFVNGAVISMTIGLALAVTCAVGIIPIRQQVERSMIPKAFIFGLLFTAVELLCVYSFKFVEIGDSVLLFGMNLVWTSIMDSIRRRVRPPISQVVGVTLAFVGMILVTKPSFIFPIDKTIRLANAQPVDNDDGYDGDIDKASAGDNDDDEDQIQFKFALGHGLAILSGILYSCFAIAMNVFGSAIHWSVWGLVQGCQMATAGAILLVVASMSTSGVDFDGGVGVNGSDVNSGALGINGSLSGVNGIDDGFATHLEATLRLVTPLVGFTVAALGMLQAVGYVAWVIAYQVSSPSLIALVAISQIPMTYTWAAIWLDERLDAVKFVGVGCILGALTIVVYSNVYCNVTKKAKGEGGEEEEEEEEMKTKLIEEP